MKLTASKTAINVIAAYCNNRGIAYEQQDKRLREGDNTSHQYEHPALIRDDKAS